MDAQQQGRIPPRPKIYRPRKDVLDMYDDADLIKRYRLDREGIMLVTDMVRDAISPRTNRSQPVSAEMKVIITLRYLATGKMQMCSGDDFGLSQAAISIVISQTLDAFVKPAFVSRFVKFPTRLADIQRNQVDFMNIAGFPGVVGCIDGTHIRIVAPSEYEAEYVNRKNYHSINTQVVFDAKFRILDVVAKWPGSTHDGRMWRECSLKPVMERYIPGGCLLLGDTGYACHRRLLTPYLQPRTDAQESYNRAHKKTRCVVERGIGQWKRVFHVLHGEVRVSPQKTCKIIMACAALYNLCKERNLDAGMQDVPVVADDGYGDVGHDQQLHPGLNQDGHRFRDHFAILHFSREN